MAIFAYCPNCGDPVSVRWPKEEYHKIPIEDQLKPGETLREGIICGSCKRCDQSAYEIIVGTTIAELTLQVNGFFRKGWRLYGNLLIQDGVFYQGITKK